MRVREVAQVTVADVMFPGGTKGASIEQVQLLLDHEGIDDTQRYIDVDPAVLRSAFEVVI
jgi:hypothetical protein